jgi:hypothetical protein
MLLPSFEPYVPAEHKGQTLAVATAMANTNKDL